MRFGRKRIMDVEEAFRAQARKDAWKLKRENYNGIIVGEIHGDPFHAIYEEELAKEFRGALLAEFFPEDHPFEDVSSRVNALKTINESIRKLENEYGKLLPRDLPYITTREAAEAQRKFAELAIRTLEQAIQENDPKKARTLKNKAIKLNVLAQFLEKFQKPQKRQRYQKFILWKMGALPADSKALQDMERIAAASKNKALAKKIWEWRNKTMAKNAAKYKRFLLYVGQAHTKEIQKDLEKRGLKVLVRNLPNLRPSEFEIEVPEYRRWLKKLGERKQ